MKTDNRSSRIVGILLLSVMISWGIGYAIVGGLLKGPDFLYNLYPAKTRLIAGVLFEIIEIASVLGIAILLFPVLKRYNENMARAYLAFRTIEGVMLISIALAALLLIPLSQSFITSEVSERGSLEAMGAVLMGLRTDWSHFILTPFYSLAALILNYVLLRTRLVPRFIAVWGLTAALLVAINQVLVVMVSHSLEFGPGMLMGLYELFLGIWLITKGFNKYQ